MNYCTNLLRVKEDQDVIVRIDLKIKINTISKIMGSEQANRLFKVMEEMFLSQINNQKQIILNLQQENEFVSELYYINKLWLIAKENLSLLRDLK